MDESFLDSTIINTKVVATDCIRSMFNGVIWDASIKQWQGIVKKNGKNISIGFFKCDLAAAVAVDKANFENNLDSRETLNFPLLYVRSNSIDPKNASEVKENHGLNGYIVSALSTSECFLPALHEHRLQLITDASYEYICDQCDTSDAGYPFHCFQCGFDACQACTKTAMENNAIKVKARDQKKQKSQIAQIDRIKPLGNEIDFTPQVLSSNENSLDTKFGMDSISNLQSANTFLDQNCNKENYNKENQITMKTEESIRVPMLPHDSALMPTVKWSTHTLGLMNNLQVK